MKKTKYIVLVFAVLASFTRVPLASASDILHEAHTPPAMDYISYCDGTYHDIHYCNFGDSFTVDKDQVATALTWFDLGCNGYDEPQMTVGYFLADADTYQVVAETTETVALACQMEYPPAHGTPFTLPIPPTTLSAGHRYFVLLHSVNNERARAYWGIDANYGSSFQVQGSAPAVTAKEPVVIIPGILGSSLERPGGAEVWPNVNAMVFSATDNYLDDLKLATNGSQLSGKEMLPGVVIERATLSLLGQNFDHVVYAELAKQFTDRGYVLGKDLFLAPYDWRMDLKDEVARLDRVVDAARSLSSSGKVNIVAHSMGGLLAKQYLADPAKAAAVDKVVLVGVPQMGAPAMFKALNYGDNLGFTLPVLNKDVLSAKKIKEIAQNMPGVYELLPSRRYVDVNGGYVKDLRGADAKTLSYDGTSALMTASAGDRRNPALLAKAQVFHNALDESSISGVQVFNLVGCDNPATLGEIRLEDHGKIDIGSVNGDGTVPFTSAMRLAEGYSNYFISSRSAGIDHMGLVRDPRSATLIGQLIEGSPVLLPSGVATSPSICFPSSGPAARSFRFSTHSPVSLHVYDPLGRHTGPTADGAIELGIPGSTYQVLASNSFVFAPAGQAYRVVAKGFAAGAFTLSSQVLEGVEPVVVTNYIDVPLAGASTIATLDFSEPNPEEPLALDRNGDGRVDVSVPPTTYRFDGFLPPVLNDGSGIYKLGNILPLRFTLKSPDGTNAGGAKANFTLTKISDAVTGTRRVIRRFKRRARFGKGSEFAYLARTKEYAFDLKTAKLSRGTWELEVELDDGQSYIVTLSFK